MSNMQVNAVLSQIRAMQSQITGSAVHGQSVQGLKPAGGATNVTGPSSNFADVLRQGLNGVNQSQLKADDMATAFQRGVPGVELSDVMLEMQKASVSFRAVTEVRNRMVSAYQEIMNMQI